MDDLVEPVMSALLEHAHFVALLYDISIVVSYPCFCKYVVHSKGLCAWIYELKELFIRGRGEHVCLFCFGIPRVIFVVVVLFMCGKRLCMWMYMLMERLFGGRFEYGLYLFFRIPNVLFYVFCCHFFVVYGKTSVDVDVYADGALFLEGALSTFGSYSRTLNPPNMCALTFFFSG